VATSHSPEALARTIFLVSMAGIGMFIAAVFHFIL